MRKHSLHTQQPRHTPLHPRLTATDAEAVHPARDLIPQRHQLTAQVCVLQVCVIQVCVIQVCDGSSLSCLLTHRGVIELQL